MHKPPCAYVLTLGCDKNRVDGELVRGVLKNAGYQLTDNAPEAEVIIINTCGFIREAVQESIEAVLGAAEYKQTGLCEKLIVTGCMSERYRGDLRTEIPEADAVLGVNELPELERLLCGYIAEESVGSPPAAQDPAPAFNPEALYLRRDPQFHVAYVKIAEGCDNRCTYCAIPGIRGPYRSRRFESILAECRALIENGARELVLVAQDTARYGTDLYERPRLHELLAEIVKLAPVWVRVMYAYPEHITSELIQTMKDNPTICRYLDMPIQHSHDAVLKRMGRSSTEERLRSVIRELRAAMPDIALRTTLMVGFPGETDEEFEHLCAFVREIGFDRLGVFPYSREEGTPAARMKQQVKASVKKKRRDTLMGLQQRIHSEKHRAQVGRRLTVMADALTETRSDGIRVFQCRSYRDAYEVDAVAIITADGDLRPGQLITVQITGSDEYDLYGELVDEPAQ